MRVPQGKQDPSPKVVLAALEHIKNRGSLQGFPGSPQNKFVLMKSVIGQGLVAWNKTAGKYELTALGQENIAHQG